VVVVGLLAFGMNSPTTTANNPASPPETTGMAPRPAPAPAPMPMTPTPQRTPSNP
jgi:hypothetical protein